MDEHLNRQHEVCVSKRRYESKEQARNAFNGYKATVPRKKGRRKNPVKHQQTPYRCDICGGWHLARIYK